MKIADHGNMAIEVELEDEAYDVVKDFAEQNGVTHNEAASLLVKRVARIQYVDGVAVLELLSNKNQPTTISLKSAMPEKPSSTD